MKATQFNCIFQNQIERFMSLYLLALAIAPGIAICFYIYFFDSCKFYFRSKHNSEAVYFFSSCAYWRSSSWGFRFLHSQEALQWKKVFTFIAYLSTSSFKCFCAFLYKSSNYFHTISHLFSVSFWRFRF